MQFWNRTSVAVLLCSSLLAACTNKETVRVEEKFLPPAKIEATATVQKNTVTFAKSSLGKLFLLMPVKTSASRAAAPQYLRPLLVSFEKNGDRIAIYNRTVDNLQSDIVADALIQTFAVVSETSDELVFEIGQGFQSLNMQDGLGLIYPRTYSFQNQIVESKSEVAVKIKDSFVKSLALKNNAIQLVQDIRIVEPFKPGLEMDPKAKKNVEMIEKIPTELEQGATLAIEIKPYQSNEEFVVRNYDEKQRFGYFINKVGRKNSDEKEPLGLIARWDIAESRGSIRVLVDPNFPENMRESMLSSVQYWNKILGREVLKVEFNSEVQLFQPDRSIVIRWIRWDKGNGAFANIQADPVTGESLRAIVYFTTTFISDKMIVDGRPKSDDLPSLPANGICHLELDSGALHKANIVQEVMTHELGHVMGLRHNFAGSANAPASDSEISVAMNKIVTEGWILPTAISSTVMDYVPGPGYSILGAYTKETVLPYDKAAIEWGYFGKETERTANMYCSDEHIFEAQVAERLLIGCKRSDLYKNVFVAGRESVIAEARNSVAKAVFSLKYILNTQPQNWSFGKYLLSFSPSLDIANKLYPQKEQPILSADDIVVNYLNNLSPWYYSEPKFTNTQSAPGDAKITEDLKELGGMKAFLDSMVPAKSLGENFFQNLVQEEKTLRLLKEAGLTEAQATEIQAGWLVRAKQLDEKEAAEAMGKLIDIDQLRKPEWKN